MPIYEYKCENCGHVVEELQKISDTPLTRCPECARETLVKIISKGGFRIKGGGVYNPSKTDLD